ncbi:MAG TPA: hypothetical protein VF984_10950 [Actinomycetota bacterium]
MSAGAVPCGCASSRRDQDVSKGRRRHPEEQGKRLFEEGTIPAGLELIDSTTSSTGVVINRYRRAGDVRFGSFAVDEQGGVEALWTEGEQR